MIKRKNNKQQKALWVLSPIILMLAVFISYSGLKLSSSDTKIDIEDLNSFPEHANIDFIQNKKMDSYFIGLPENKEYQVHFIKKSEDLVQIKASGFSPQQPLSLQLDGKKIIKQLPSDWAGRIELETRHKPNATLCLILNNENVSVCNLLATKSGGNV